jgi:exopolyphosphatase / guanosine-5'-triphosphate,3'-diphosphate pyrophosphatase
MTRIATLDIGTNTILLLVAEPGPDGLQAVRERCEFARLGQGMDASGAIADEALARGLGVLRDYRAVCDQLEVERIAAVGTQALREAANARDFLEPARQILGVEVEVISGEREAELVFRAVSESFPVLARDRLVVADVGGGSTEVTVAEAGQLTSFRSVPIGAVRMSERHLKDDPPGPEQCRAMIADVDRALAELELPAGAPLVAVSGTATTMAAVEQRLRDYDPDRVHGYRLAPAVVDRQLARYLELTVEERRRLPGMEPKRADVIAGGVCIFSRLLARIGSDELMISDRGVRWGLAYELAGA